MASREYYLKEDSDKYLSAYRKMLEESYMAFGADPEVAVDAANDVVDFETEIANVGFFLEIMSFFTVHCIVGSFGRNFTSHIHFQGFLSNWQISKYA